MYTQSTFSGLLIKPRSENKCKDGNGRGWYSLQSVRLMNQLFGDIGHYKLLNCLYLLRMFGKFCKVIMKISKLWENQTIAACIGYSA